MSERITQYAKQLRHNQTKAEKLLWNELRNRKCGGYKFRRQVKVDVYIVDFFCVAKKTVIEVDGPTHEGGEAYDTERSKHLEMRGYQVLRFKNEDVFDGLESVLGAIYEALKV